MMEDTGKITPSRSRIRSSSESDIEHRSSTPQAPIPTPRRRVGLLNSNNMSVSQDVLSSTTNHTLGFSETPLGTGYGTRLQSQGTVTNDTKELIIADFERLVQEVNEWETLLSITDVPSQEVEAYAKKFTIFSANITDRALRSRGFNVLTHSQMLTLPDRILKIKRKILKKITSAIPPINPRPAPPEPPNPPDPSTTLQSVSINQSPSVESSSINTTSATAIASRTSHLRAEATHGYLPVSASEIQCSNTVIQQLENLQTTVSGVVSSQAVFQRDLLAEQEIRIHLTTNVAANKVRLGKMEQLLTTVKSTMGEFQSDVTNTHEQFEVWMRNTSKVIDNIKLSNNNRETVDDPFSIPNSAGSTATDSNRYTGPTIAEFESLKCDLKNTNAVLAGLHHLILDVRDQLENRMDPQVSVGSNSGENGNHTNLYRAHDGGPLPEVGVLRRDIQRFVDQMSSIIQTPISQDCANIALIKRCASVEVPALREDSKQCGPLLRKYSNMIGADQYYVADVMDLQDRVSCWIALVIELYKKQEIHSIKDTLFDAADVGIFSDNSQRSVYEFLKVFDSAYEGRGSQKQIAYNLFTKHISNDIKEKVFYISEDLESMKSWLIMNYGKAASIVSDVVVALMKKKKPLRENKKDRYHFFSDILLALLRLEKLTKESAISRDDLEGTLFSQSTLRDLISVLPPNENEEFIRQMYLRGLDYRNPAGFQTFLCFRSICEMERSAMEPYKDSDTTGNKKTRSVFAAEAVISSESDSDDKPAVHTTGSKNMSSANKKTNSGPPTFTQWYKPGLKFPCPLLDHKHEITKCSEFFTLNPRERRGLIQNKTICFTCLRPKDKCKAKKCSITSKIPQDLLCVGCKTYAKTMGMEPLNILLCVRDDHADLRATPEAIRKALEKHLGPFDASISNSPIVYSANFIFHTAHTQQSINQVHGCIEGTETPTIDTSTGARVKNVEEIIVPEVKQHAFYLMQIIKIGSTQVQLFFDSGANAHLISGELAVTEGLQLISDKPTSITVVGGDRVRTQYGSYRVNLGPDCNGEYHELSCIGMNSITSKFNKYDLFDIRAEFKEAVGDNDEFVKLPEYTGGDEVKLLIGIKNTRIDPVLITTLPSGISVYRSPFKDIWGSRIIFAGPHQTFTRTNQDSLSQYHFAALFMQDQVSRVVTDFDVREIFYSHYADKKKGITFHPSPVTAEDFIDAGAQVDPQLEDILDHDPDSLRSKISGAEAHYCAVHKAIIPIAKMRELLDIDDLNDLVTYRCSSCSKCVTCKKSRRHSAISLQESMEQEIIKSSVTVDYEKNKVYVSLPFLKDPVDPLLKKHGSPSNYRQAEKVYRSQCKASEAARAGMRIVHDDLVKQGFMQRLSEMPENIKIIIKNAPFQHFHPWRIVYKESQSTPVRMVVDPTMTGLNILLAKGENKLGNIFDILVRNRVRHFAWTSDIKKLYNQLQLKDSALPFSLFLYHNNLDLDTEPEVWVMKVAWYGVVPTGNQAGYAIETLVEDHKDEFPDAIGPLTEDKYVDDVGSGANTSELREKQINDARAVLAKGGFDMKYIVRSGEPPCEKASSDGETMKLLGYKWNVVEDTLSPGLSDLNFNKKVRGARKPNENPIISNEDVKALLDKVKFTRRIVVAKVAEHYDPVGWFEALKLQLKLELSRLNQFSWDEELPCDLQVLWKELLQTHIGYVNITIPRVCVPPDDMCCSKIRLLCLSDAGKDAAGTIIYAGRKLLDGSWSCALLAAKSKLVDKTIPRNELSAILMMSELAYIVRKSLGDRVDQMIYATDSTIALSWCHNTNKKLRSFTFNRVETIRRMISWTTESDDIPLYHIDGLLNVADLLTKKHQLTPQDVSAGSVWQDGLPWMRLDRSQMPLRSYDSLTVSKLEEVLVQEECFSEPFFVTQIEENHCVDAAFSVHESVNIVQPGKASLELIIDPIYYGWRRTVRLLTIVSCWRKKFLHNKHAQSMDGCYFCSTPRQFWNPSHSSDDAEKYLFRYETSVIKSKKTGESLKKFKEVDSILYLRGRLSKEAPFKVRDLDGVPFLDAYEFTDMIPVVLSSSPVLYSYLMEIHFNILPHSGVEITCKETFKKMAVLDGLRNIIRKVKSGCIMCRKIERKTLELEMSHHHQARTILAPPFYSCMMDIAYGFPGKPHKNARSKIKIYALIIVCIATGATSILVLEGLETQDVVQAIERHSSCHGTPSHLYIDNGTQLKALESASFSIRDFHTAVFNKSTMKVHVSTPKAHEERGRVERRIQLIRSMLERMGIHATSPQTAIQWQTVFAKIANTIDDLPMAKGNTSNSSFTGFEILSANRIKLGRNNARSLEGPGITIDLSQDLSKLLTRNREIYQYWYQLFIDNIHLLTLKPGKWSDTSKIPVVGDIVLFTFTDSGYSKESITWKLGKVVSVGSRKVAISYVANPVKKGPSVLSVVERNFRSISIIYSTDELALNSIDHFSSIINVE